MNFLARPKRELLQTLALLLIPLAAPLLLPADPKPGDENAPPMPFEQPKLDYALKTKPEVMLLGNSMLNTRVDKHLFAKLVKPNKVAFVTEGGTRSLVWYFMLKNFVGPVDPPPKLVFVFFRDFDFNSPGLNLTGEWLQEAHGYMKPDDHQLLENARAMGGTPPNEALDFYLPYFFAKECREKVMSRAMDIAAAGGGVDDIDLQKAHQEAFDFDKLRPDVFDPGALENDTMDVNKRVFTSDPSETLLPLYAEVAKQRGFQLCFYRVKRRPDEAGNAPSSPQLTEYMKNFRIWAESHGHLVMDETDDPRLTLDMYHDGDHVAKPSMDKYTRMFVERVRAVLPLPFSPAPAP